MSPAFGCDLSGPRKGEPYDGVLTKEDGNGKWWEGLIVNVLSNGNVEIERWDTYRNEEILPKWLVKAPHDGSNFTYNNRNGLPAPVFANVVHHYVIVVSEGEQEVARFSKFSQFYLNSKMPAELSVGFSGLPCMPTIPDSSAPSWIQRPKVILSDFQY
jgi:hypothetical protein